MPKVDNDHTPAANEHGEGRAADEDERRGDDVADVAAPSLRSGGPLACGPSCGGCGGCGGCDLGWHEGEHRLARTKEAGEPPGVGARARERAFPRRSRSVQHAPLPHWMMLRILSPSSQTPGVARRRRGRSASSCRCASRWLTVSVRALLLHGAQMLATCSCVIEFRRGRLGRAVFVVLPLQADRLAPQPAVQEQSRAPCHRSLRGKGRCSLCRRRDLSRSRRHGCNCVGRLLGTGPLPVSLSADACGSVRRRGVGRGHRPSGLCRGTPRGAESRLDGFAARSPAPAARRADQLPRAGRACRRCGMGPCPAAFIARCHVALHALTLQLRHRALFTCQHKDSNRGLMRRFGLPFLGCQTFGVHGRPSQPMG